MSPAKVSISVNVKVPFERAAELAAATVNALGWRIKFVDQSLKRLTASDHKVEVIGRDTWRFEFDLSIRWKKSDKSGAGTEYSIDVSERQMAWTEPQCKERSKAIVDGLKEDAAQLVSSNNSSDSYGSANWASFDDLDDAGYVVFRGDHTRLILGPAEDPDEVISVPGPETAMHCTVCGPTGSGKSSTVYIPNLIERTGISAIVTEATAGSEEPDLFNKTSGFRKKAGHKIYYFNPDDLRSTRINPIEHLKTYDEASHVANLIIQNTSGKNSSGDKIWEDSERQLLKSLILYAMGEGGTLGDIRAWLREGPDKLGMLLMNSTYELAQKEFWGFFKNSSEGFRFGVISGLMQRLNLWVSPKVVALTEKTDLDINELPNEMFTFYLAVPAQKTELKPLSALVFNFILDLALQKKFKYPLNLFLDEFTNYGYIPGIAEKMTIIRHRNIPAMLGFQDYVQLRKVYGDDDATLLFSQPGTRFVFRPRDNTTAKKVSDALGTKTISERKVTSSGSISEREFGRKLMSPDEVTALKPGHAIVFTPSTNPILLKTFTWQNYLDAAACDAPEFRKVEVDEKLKERCKEAAAPGSWQQETSSKKKDSKPKYDRNRYGNERKSEPVKNKKEELEHEEEERELDLEAKKATPSRFDMREDI